MKKFWIPIGLFVLIGVLLAYGLSLDPRKIPSPLVDKPLPAFSLPTLENPKKVVTNTDLHGKVVIINVWASWCAACKVEHPVLMAFTQRQAAPLIGLNYKDAPEDALAVLKADGNPYKVSLLDRDGRTGIDWGVYGVPETFVVDKEGVIRYKHIGPISAEDIQDTLLPLLEKLR